jgi:predicted ATPase
MLTSLHLKQFKAWADTGPMALKPITLLLGTNSSGKSSLIQSLLLLKQTVDSPDRTIHLNLGGDERNDVFNFGDFSSILTQGSTDRQFEIHFTFSRSSTDERIAAGAFHAVYGQTANGAVVTQLLRLSGQADDRVFRVQRREKGAFAIYVDSEQTTRGKSRDYAPERSIAFASKAVTLLGEDGSVVQDISLAIRRELEGLVYLGPLRQKPLREYPWNKGKPGVIEPDGRQAIDALLASALLQGPDHKRIIQKVAHWLKRMDLADQLDVRQVGRSTRYEVVIDSQSISANLRDVGIGISQVLPVLTVAFFAPPGSTVILEEPEIHLHPLAQSVLAELFAEASRERRIQFVIETHSEHLFRRMQTLVAREELSTEDCELYFVEKEQGQAQLRRLELDSCGRVINWPERFFGDALAETREQTHLTIQRLKKQRANTES